jgi:hypothetical protein
VMTIPSTTDNPDGIVKCYHNLLAVIYVSQSKANPGREYYQCPKPRNDLERCKFFKWVDECAPKDNDACSDPPSYSQTVPRDSIPASSPTKSTVAGLDRYMTSTRSRFTPASSQPPSSQLTMKGTPNNGFPFSSQESPTKKRKFANNLIESDEEPFSSQNSAAMKLDFGPTPSSSQIKVPKSPSKTPARTTGASNGIADVISELENLKTTVETLERKLFATEQSQAQKVRKITELEQTIRTLTEKNDYLEKDLKDLQERVM